MNGKAAKRIRLAAGRQNYHINAYFCEGYGQTVRETYRRLKREYKASPYHSRPCYGWSHHSHKERIEFARFLINEERLRKLREERTRVMADFITTEEQDLAAFEFFAQPAESSPEEFSAFLDLPDEPRSQAAQGQIDHIIEENTKRIAESMGLQPEQLTGATPPDRRSLAAQILAGKVRASDYVTVTTPYPHAIKCVTGRDKLI